MAVFLYNVTASEVETYLNNKPILEPCFSIYCLDILVTSSRPHSINMNWFTSLRPPLIESKTWQPFNLNCFSALPNVAFIINAVLMSYIQ